MLPAFLITLREVIEATLIVATVLGILIKLKQTKSIKTVWLATTAALLVSLVLLGLGSFLGLKIQEVYTGRAEQLFEGSMMIISAIFITSAVFWLHTYFASYKIKLLQKVKTTIDEQKQWRLFLLVFTAVFREGIEIVLFLSTIYLSSSPISVFSGFGLGLTGGLLISLAFFTATFKMPVLRAFQTTSVLLILFAAGLLARGVHEFVEAGFIPEFQIVTLSLLPAKGTISGDFIKAIFGLTHSMDYIQLALYAAYIALMRWFLYTRKHILTP